MLADLPRPSAVLMGPQRLFPMLDQALDLLDITGKVAVITAGWQEREPEDDELCAALGGRPAVNLRLHARGDEAFLEDKDLLTRHRAKQDTLKSLQVLYRKRLTHAMAAASEMQALLAPPVHGHQVASMPGELVQEQLDGAISWVRRLDDEHVRLVADINAEFMDTCKPVERPAIARHRDEIRALLGDCSAVAIAGGHVAVLLNRIQLFGLARELAQLPILAWSAGAMVVTERIVLFHDSPPQGRGFAEVLGHGLGFLPDIVALPHARTRLLLNDPQRIALFARRFAPRTGVTLDEHCSVAHFVGSLGNGMWRANEHVRRLSLDGSCVAMEAQS